jgi:probable HAF family extracellular repeat protein
MKSQLTFAAAVVTLFVLLPISVQLAAQDKQDHHHMHHRYRLIDTGTFGGPESYINAAFSLGSPNQINRRGTVVGAAATDIPAPPNKQICGGPDGLVPFVFHAFVWQEGKKKDLGVLPGVECSEAVSINSQGEIAGRSGNGVIDPLVGLEEIRGVIWRDGEIQDLGTLGGNHSIAVAINNRSQVVGFSVNTIPDPFSLLYFLGGGFTNGTETRGFLWQNGQVRDLGTLGGPDAQAFGLNDRGQVTGISYINSTPNPVTGLPPADPFFWSEDRGMVDLGTLGGVWGGAGALNNRGQVIGTSSLAADPGACLGIGDTANCHPFFWGDGRLVDLNADTIGGSPVTAEAINDAGEVVGNAVFPNGATYGDAYLWKEGVITKLGGFPGDCYSEAFAINSRGQAVGQHFNCDTRSGGSVLWEHGAMFDLNTLIPANSDLLLDNTFAINDRGEIAGFGLPSGCTLDTLCGHAFVLIPCEKEHSNDEGCESEDATAPAIQGNPATTNKIATAAMEVSLTPREIAARIHRGFARKSLFDHTASPIR